MTPIRIFISIPWFYPAFRAGGPVQSVLNLVNSGMEGVEFYVFTSARDLNMVRLNVETGKWLEFNPQTKVYYSTSNNRSRVLLEQMEKTRAQTVFIIGVYSWHFTIVPLFFGKPKHKIVSARGMLHRGAMEQKALKKKIYFLGWKLFRLQKKAVFHATDVLEREMIEKFFKDPPPVYVVPNIAREMHPLPLPEKKKGSLILCSVALISPMKNIHLVLEALRRFTGDVVYHLYGPVKDAAYWNLCKDIIVQMPVNIRVVHHGEILPEEVKDALHQSHVFILPSISENFGHSILEAMQTGRPVITSKGTPWNNLQQVHAGWNVDAGIEQIGKAIGFFCDMDQQELERWSDGATHYALSKRDNAATEKLYLELFTPPKEKIEGDEMVE